MEMIIWVLQQDEFGEIYNRAKNNEVWQNSFKMICQFVYTEVRAQTASSILSLTAVFVFNARENQIRLD